MVKKVRSSPQRNFPPDPFMPPSSCLPAPAPTSLLSIIVSSDQHDLYQAWTNYTIWKMEREKSLEYNKHIQIDWKTLLWYVCKTSQICNKKIETRPDIWSLSCCRMNLVYTFRCVITVSLVVHYINLINLSLSFLNINILQIDYILFAQHAESGPTQKCYYFWTSNHTFQAKLSKTYLTRFQ